MLTLKPLSSTEIRTLHTERMQKDFPRKELKKLNLILHLMRRGRYSAYITLEEQEDIGYAFFTRDPCKNKLYLLDYYAIREDLRNQGYGSELLKLFSEKFKESTILLCEVENPFLEEDPLLRASMERRMDFYLRNGWWDTRVNARMFGVEYRLLAAPVSQKLSREKIADCYRLIYRNVVPTRRLKKNMKLRFAEE